MEYFFSISCLLFVWLVVWITFKSHLICFSSLNSFPLKTAAENSLFGSRHSLEASIYSRLLNP